MPNVMQSPALKSRPRSLLKTLHSQRYLLIMVVPGVIWFLIFCYYPMYGVTLGFKQYFIGRSMADAPWVGLQHFREFINSTDFMPVMRNTVAISLLKLLLCFPAGIIFALLLNEITQNRFKRVVQTISYLPHFISWVVVANLMYQMLSPTDGAVNALLMGIGVIKEPVMFMGKPQYFWWVIVFSENWKEVGWNAIIFLAAITAVNPQLYEAAAVDGVSRWKMVWHITLPSISSTIMVMFVLALAGILSTNFDQMWMMRNATVLSHAEVIDTHVYRLGIQLARYDYATAVGLFKSVIGLIMLVIANEGARRINDTSLF